jgi:hypothetical protein
MKEIISSEEDAKIFVDTIENPPAPNEKLKNAFEKQLNQETLEEAAERIAENFKNVDFKAGVIYGIIEGAKSEAARDYWFKQFQQEQDKNKYSEEEVLKHLNHLIMMPSSKLDKFTNDEEMVTMKWFEQFKENKL